jgi:L-threonylcarbamoyladenylate synthase
MDLEKDILNCMEVLKNGGLILYPTDTVWGIGCDATNDDAVEKIFQLKQRPENKSMIVLVAEEKEILKHVASPDLAVFDFLDQSDKPTTVIYNGALGLAPNLSGDDNSIAIRICKDLFCRQLLKRIRKPIVSTSANISGEITPTIFKEISEKIKKGVDYIVEYRQHDETIAVASRVIRWNNNGTFEVLRN